MMRTFCSQDCPKGCCRQFVGIGGLLLLLALTGLPGTAAHAEGSDRRLTIRPSLRVRAVSDDNAFLTRNDTESELATWIEPRLEIEYRRAAWKAGADLGLELRYSDLTERHKESFFDVTGFAEWEPLRGVRLRLSDTYAPQAIRLGRPDDATGNLSETNLLHFDLRWRREGSRATAFEAGVGGSRFTTDGFASALDLDGDGLGDETDDLRSDYWDADAFLEFQYGLGRRGLMYVRGELRDRRFDEIPRSDFQEVSGLFGVRSSPGSRITLDAALGWGSVEYEDLDADDRLIGRLELDYELPREMRLTGLFVQRFTSGAASSDFGETTFRLGLDKDFGSRNRASLGLLLSRFHSDDPGADATHVSSLELGFQRQLTRRVQGGIRYRHWRSGFDVGDDDVRQNRVMLELNYRR